MAGDSLLVMNSLLEKEGLAGKVQMIYIDPPYGIRYGSNFQPFVNRRDVKDGKDDDLTQEPEMVKAFRDTWELGVHSYLTYLRDRLLLARELLHESGSVFVQISDENLHHVRELMDDVFGSENAVAIIPVVKTAGLGATGLPNVCDYLLWHSRGRAGLKYNQLYLSRELGDPGSNQYTRVECDSGTRRRMTLAERNNFALLDDDVRVYRLDNLTSGAFRENTTIPYTFDGQIYHPGNNKCWKTTKEGLDRLTAARRIERSGRGLAYVRFIDDFPVQPLKALWTDTGTGGFGDDKVYVVQTTQKIIQRCMMMTTDPGDLVLDPTCGSGTTAFVAEQWGRRWITCDTSRVAVTLTKQRLLTGVFDYYKLAHPKEGVGSGFVYKTVPHVTLKSIANN
ncbi:MAG: site-specific DNA-methyltransferase, partial [Planctomycetales bacterium]|nr:site-specific DNA-methyltransferase [Planctomycetales bacterium]